MPGTRQQNAWIFKHFVADGGAGQRFSAPLWGLPLPKPLQPIESATHIAAQARYARMTIAASEPRKGSAMLLQHKRAADL